MNRRNFITGIVSVVVAAFARPWTLFRDSTRIPYTYKVTVNDCEWTNERYWVLKSIHTDNVDPESGTAFVTISYVWEGDGKYGTIVTPSNADDFKQFGF
jgi:hypothetical protein